MPLALTWSELSTWEEDVDKWVRGYVLGFKDPPNHYMQRGTDIHEMLFTKKRDCEKGKYTPDQIRVHDKIIKEFDKIREGWEHERKIEAEIKGIPIKGYLDGWRKYELLEVKTGSQLWTQERANNHGQLFFYDLLLEMNGLPVMNNYLFSCSTTNGKCVRLHVKVLEKQFQNIQKRIQNAHDWMVAEGFWDKRVSSAERIIV